MYSGTSPVHSCSIYYRLSLMAMADYEVHLQILSETRQKNPVIPKHDKKRISIYHSVNIHTQIALKINHNLVCKCCSDLECGVHGRGHLQ